MTQDELLRLVDRVHRSFRVDPLGAFRDFLRVEERLRLDGEERAVRALADAVWVAAPEAPFPSPGERADFFRALAHYLASPGPAADPGRSREILEALEVRPPRVGS